MDEELIEQTTEKSIEVKPAEVIESTVTVADLEQSTKVDEEEVVSVDVAPVEEIEIDVDEAVGWAGGDSTQHSSLSGRDEPNQHPISAISGLRDELNEIEALKTIYSDKNGIANYYEWYDGEHTEYGYFVSLVPHTSKITICDGADIFGVTVDSAGFVGLQDKDFPRNNNYGLVVTSGLVDIRCESTVSEGDYVVSNSYGVATKTDSGCGYKVIAIEDKHGVFYASISLGVQAYVTDTLGKELQHLDGRMGDAEINIAAAMNTANEAYNKAAESISSNESMSNQITDALVKVDDMATNIGNMGAQVGDITAISAQAKAIAESAVTSAESARNEAVTKANEALDKAGEIEKTVEPISSWEYTDPVTGETNTGATYFAEYVKNGLSTKAEMETVSKLDEENKLLIEKNAENYTQMLSSIDKYTIGEYSQAYGLMLEQARNILKVGMMYIPTVNHTEPLFAGGTKEMLRNAFYVWTGESWGNETLNSVWLGSNNPGNSYQYWYTELDDVAEGYQAHTLYINNDDEWVEVATLAGNVNNRITSMIRQDVNSVTAEVVNARGSAASLGARLDEDGARVSMVASVVTELSDTAPIGIYDTIYALPETAESGAYYCVGTSAPYDVYKWNGTEFEKELLIYYDGAHFCMVNTASIVNAVNNNGDSSISLNANKINFSGLSTFFSTDENGGITEINGSGITTGTIDANKVTITNIDASNITTGTMKAGIIQSPNYVSGTSGLKINLVDGTVDITGKITATSGNIGGCSIVKGVLEVPVANIKGTITATELEVKKGSYTYFKAGDGAVQIGGFNVDNNSLYSGSTFSNSEVFLCTGSTGYLTIGGHYGTSWGLKVGTKFGVNTSGELYCTSANLSGSIEATSGTFHSGCILGQNLQITEWESNFTALCTMGMTLPSSLLEAPSSSTAGIILISSADSEIGVLSFRSPMSRSNLSANSFEIYDAGSYSHTREMKFKAANIYGYTGEVLNYALEAVYSDGDCYVLGRGEWRIGATKTSGSWYYSMKANIANSSAGGGGALLGTWTGTVSSGSGSDRNIKHNIEDMPEAYEKLFDDLRPVRFKYDDGTSDRYHTGFIAQEVKAATEAAGLSTQDFAAYYTFERQISETEYVTTAALRYGEFVSLNTWEIQKLKSRVSELESIVAKLQEG